MAATFKAFKSTLGYDVELPGSLRQVDKTEDVALSEKPQKAALRFAHPSGSKPLPGYTIKRGVGTGGFGEVYFAVSDAGKEVALKKIQRHLEIELRGVSHCLNLKHPNLISLYDVRYDDDGQAWVVMEYVGGPNMRQSLDMAPQGFSVEETLRWFAGLAAGVAHLHEAGIVHRDLKPGNVFDDDGIVKIGDYGLSKYISCSQRGGHTESIGTFHYMAPEVGRGNYGREIDIYAMGIILFEMLTGTVPFDGESSQEIVMKHLTDNPDLSGVAEPYRGVIWQAMQKNPSARQHSVAQMVSPLGIVIDSHGIARIQAHGPSPVGKMNVPRITGQQREAGSGDGIHFVASPVAARAGNSRNDAAGTSEVRFGEVRYHDPSPVPLAGAVPSNEPAWDSWAACKFSETWPKSVKGIEGNLSGLGKWWASLEAAPGAQTVILVVGLIALLLNPWLMTLGVVLGLGYATYVLIKSFFFAEASGQTRYSANGTGISVVSPQPVTAWVPRAAPRPMTVKQWIAQRRPELSIQKKSLKAADFLGSTLVAVIASFLIGSAAVWAVYSVGGFGESIAYAVAAGSLIGMVGTILLLGVGKVWEGESSSSFSRRTVLVGIGAAVGMFGYQVSNYLYLLSEGFEGIGTTDVFAEGAFQMEGASEAMLWMGHYAIVFMLLRWWLNTDPLRVRRISIWRVAVALVAEWLVQLFIGVSQPTVFTSIIVMAIVTQVASPWENPKARLREANRRLQMA